MELIEHHRCSRYIVVYTGEYMYALYSTGFDGADSFVDPTRFS